MVLRLPGTTRDGMASVVKNAADAGAGPATCTVYTGAQPATGDTAASGTALVVIPMGDPAFTGPVNGVLTAADPAPVAATANGTAGWWRLRDSNGNSVIDGDCTVTGGGGDMQLATTSVTVGLSLDITSWTFTMPSS